MSGYEQINYAHEHDSEVTVHLSGLLDVIRERITEIRTMQPTKEVLHSNEATWMVDDTHPDDESMQTDSHEYAFYNTAKDVTTVVACSTSIIDGHLHEAYYASYFRGAPFGHVYDPTEGTLQFDAKVNKVSDARLTDAEAERLRSRLAELEERQDENMLDFGALQIVRGTLRAHEMGVEPEPIARTSGIYDVELNNYRDLFILADRRLPMETDVLYSDEPGSIYVDEVDEGVLLAEIASMRIWVERADTVLDTF